MTADLAKTGTVFNIQKFSVNDGPGIRTVVFLKGCPLHCRWCANPESQMSQVQILWDEKKCVHCHHCIQTCDRQHAVSLINDHITVNPLLCDGCMKCVKECPGHALKPEGEIMTVKQVMDKVMQDEVFYEESGGGLTLSGGEMLMQPEFSIELLKAAKEKHLHTACETTGYADPQTFKAVIENLDYMLFDMKHWDSGKHQEYTGVPNDLILQNMSSAISAGKEVLPRIPVIPGFNDSPEDAEKLAEALKKAGADKCQLLPFHQFGENKYDMLNRPYAYKGMNAYHKEDLQDYCQVFHKHGIDAYF